MHLASHIWRTTCFPVDCAELRAFRWAGLYKITLVVNLSQKARVRGEGELTSCMKLVMYTWNYATASCGVLVQKPVSGAAEQCRHASGKDVLVLTQNLQLLTLSMLHGLLQHLISRGKGHDESEGAYVTFRYTVPTDKKEDFVERWRVCCSCS